MQPDPIERTEVSLPQKLCQWVPSLTVVDGWHENIPLPLFKSAQIIADTTGEAIETALAPSLCILGSLLRRRRVIASPIETHLYPEINCLLIRDSHITRLNWFHAICSTWLNHDAIEHALLDHMKEGELLEIKGIPVCARRSIVLSEPRPSQVMSHLARLGEQSSMLLHNRTSALSDELSNLTASEIRELARMLHFSWESENLGDGRGGRKDGLSLLWSIAASEFPSMRSAFLERTIPVPILMLESQTQTNDLCAKAVEPLDQLHGLIWQSSLHHLNRVPFTDEQQSKIYATAQAIEGDITSIPDAKVRSFLHWIPGLYMRIAMLLVILSDDESLVPLDGAMQLTAALTQRHYDTLRKFTGDFTAASEPITENPAEVFAEYELLAKIDHLAPVSRTELNRRYSNDKRKQLESLLVRLLRDGRIMMDAQKRYSVRSLVSV